MKMKKNSLIKQFRQKLSVKNSNKSKMTLKDSQDMVLNDSTPFIITEAYKTTRTNIIFSVAGTTEKHCKIIVFTSASPGEGKTTTTLNMGITFAQTGAQVLIIDGDLRKPKLHQYLKQDKSKGLSSILVEEYTWEEGIVKDVRPHLDFMPSGPIPPNPAELLSSRGMQKLLETLSEHYDYILIDTPPVNVVTDATTLSKFVAGYIIVVRQNYTHHESIAQAINLLHIADAKLLGFFSNDATNNNTSYGHYKQGYRYKYNYQYGYTPETKKRDKKQAKKTSGNKIVKEDFQRAVLSPQKPQGEIKYVPADPNSIQRPSPAAPEQKNESSSGESETPSSPQADDTK